MRNGFRPSQEVRVKLRIDGRVQTRVYDTSYVKNRRTVYVEVKNGYSARRTAAQRRFDEEMARLGRNVETWRVNIE